MRQVSHGQWDALKSNKEAASGPLLTLSLNLFYLFYFTLFYFALFYEVLSSFCTGNLLRMEEVGGRGGGSPAAPQLSLFCSQPLESHCRRPPGTNPSLLHTLSAVGVCF